MDDIAAHREVLFTDDDFRIVDSSLYETHGVFQFA